MKSTKEMRDRARELATPPRDDFDRAVLYILDDLDAALLVVEAPDQTNAEVSDERLREIIDGCEGVTPGPWRAEEGNEGARGILAPQKPDGSSMVVADVYSWPEVVADNAAHIARCDPETIRYLATAELNRRSVTSQASEGEVVGWIDPAQLAEHARADAALTNVSLLTKEFAEAICPTAVPVYASPSKRVERLETALRAMLQHTGVRDAAAEDKDEEDHLAERLARQALGDRS